jgi:hypothetical protein
LEKVEMRVKYWDVKALYLLGDYKEALEEVNDRIRELE